MRCGLRVSTISSADGSLPRGLDLRRRGVKQQPMRDVQPELQTSGGHQTCHPAKLTSGLACHPLRCCSGRKVALDIAEALHYLHSSSYTHFDIKSRCVSALAGWESALSG